MKNSIHILLATLMLIALLNPGSIMANPAPDAMHMIVKVSPSTEGKALSLRMANLQQQTTKVKIMDLWGYSLLSEMVVKEDGYSKLINLENLPKGDYLLYIDHPNGAFTHAFHLSKEKVTFFETDEAQDGFVRLVGQSDSDQLASGKVSVVNDQLNLEIEALTGRVSYMHVCNLEGKMFFRKKVKGAKALEETIAINELPQGDYLLVVRSGNKTLVQSFEKGESMVSLKNRLVSKEAVAPLEVYSQR